MEINSYEKYFNNWECWGSFEPRFDGLNGVYAFRLKAAFPRLKGVTQIVYIGMCNQNPKGKNPGLLFRLQNYLQNLAGGSNRLKDLEAEFKGRAGIEYAYVVCDYPRVVEKALLEDYYKQHLELPPLDRAG
ncbi:MAG: hypothetical protein RBT80_24725 [Candidatus Vecturithrix sp.]|jgi:hypothetical protein|nr:hypothetical protein [Candidatus Vecturithrix sp.]